MADVPLNRDPIIPRDLSFAAAITADKGVNRKVWREQRCEDFKAEYQKIEYLEPSSAAQRSENSLLCLPDMQLHRIMAAVAAMKWPDAGLVNMLARRGRPARTMQSRRHLSGKSHKGYWINR